MPKRTAQAELVRVSISEIRTDGATQPRAELSQEVIEDYSEAMRAGAVFPPVTVFYDGEQYWLADGFHRLKAASGAEQDVIAAVVHQGTQEDAQWFSFAANQDHGLRRTNADKQRAVQAALGHPNSRTLSDREIARHLGVHHDTVSDWRQKLSVGIRQIEKTEPEKRVVTRRGTEYDQNVSNIGTSKRSKQKDSEASTPSRRYVPASEQEQVEVEPEETTPTTSRSGEGIVSIAQATKIILRAHLGDLDWQFLRHDPGLVDDMEAAGNRLKEIAADVRSARKEAKATA